MYRRPRATIKVTNDLPQDAGETSYLPNETTGNDTSDSMSENNANTASLNSANEIETPRVTPSDSESASESGNSDPHNQTIRPLEQVNAKDSASTNVNKNTPERMQTQDTISESPESLFQPKKRKLRHSPGKTNPNEPKMPKNYSGNEIPVSNRYEPLSEIEDDEDNGPDPTQKDTTEKPPPPLVFPGDPSNFKKLIETLKQFGKSGFHIKNNTNSVSVFFKTRMDKDAFTNYLDNENKKTEYYTYTHKNDKTHAFVLRGLDCAPEIVELAEELRHAGLEVRNVYRMRTEHRPLYLVTTNNTVTLKEICNRIKFVSYTKISWERHINKKELTQCHRCQMWGHATSNCRLRTKCMKCAGQHWSRECTKARDETPTCANCKGDHTSNNIICPVYERLIRNRQQQQAERKEQNIQRKTNNTRYVPAPLPSRNVWEDRKAATSNSQTQSNIQPRQTTESATPSTRQHCIHCQTNKSQPTVSSNHNQIPQNQQTHNTTKTNPKGESLTDLNSLINQINILNNKINISGMLAAITDLNKLLDSTTDKGECLIKTVGFLNNLSKYDL